MLNSCALTVVIYQASITVDLLDGWILRWGTKKIYQANTPHIRTICKFQVST